MPEFEIINPSDPYTIVGEQTVCDVAIAIVSNGQYGIKNIDGGYDGPLMAFDSRGYDEWIEEETCGSYETLADYIEMNKKEIGEALLTVLLCKPGERAEVEAELKKMDPDKRQAWLDKRHDECRSSMNNIGQYCWDLGHALTKNASPGDESLLGGAAGPTNQPTNQE